MSRRVFREGRPPVEKWVFSIHPDQELDRIVAGLTDAGAMALVLIEAGSLDRIERRCGSEAYRRSADGLMNLVGDLAEQVLPAESIFLTEERSRGAILVFMFRSRSDHRFYGEALSQFAERVTTELARQGRRAVYPYQREPLDLPVGYSVLLHNPTVKPERQIMQSVEEAHRDAQLQDSVRSRRYGRELLQVILTSNIHVRFEPIVDLKSARVLGYEALTRGPAGSDLASPQQLFHQAEKSGLLFDLDCLCRSVALEAARLLPRNKVVFLNCLPTAIGDPNLRDEGLRKVLENYDLQPSDMVLEISESESIENFGVFREVSDACRELGIRIAIDDAGPGYAGLEAIMEIAPDFIKTDMVLVRGIDADPSRQEVLRALATVARGIGAEVIAEGIETDREFQALRRIGIDYGQGYYFGAAVSGESDRPLR